MRIPETAVLVSATYTLDDHGVRRKTEQQKPRASPVNDCINRKRKQIACGGEEVLRAHDLIFTPEAIIPKRQSPEVKCI